MPRRFPRWTLKTAGEVAPEERLPWPQTIAMGLQHVVALFGATALAPVLMGFDPNTAILFSGLGTLLFFACTGGRLPSYLGSSFAFIAVVLAAAGHPAGAGPNSNLALALGGIVAAGAAVASAGLVVHLAGTAWVEQLMPPAVTGAVVAAIGLNLAPVAARAASAAGGFCAAVALLTVLAVAVVAARARGLPRRLSILLGAACGYACYALGANLLGLGAPIDFTPVAAAPWLSLPRFEAPAFSASAVALIAPVAVALVAEWPGATSTRCSGARSSPTARRRSSPVSAAGRGVTTYAENMGVMAATRVYSTLVFLVAACFALRLGLSPKFGALILTLPVPVLGGVSLVVFGLIVATGARIWAAHRVDLASPRNLLTAVVALTAGAGDLTVRVGGFATGGTCTATFRAILLYHLLSGGETGSSRRAGTEADGAPADRWRFECRVGEAPRPGEAAAHPPRAATPSAGASCAWPTLRSRFWRTRARME